MSQRLLIVVTDLLFQARIADAVRTLGVEPLTIDGAQALTDALGDEPAAAVIDLHERSLDALDSIRELSAAHARVLAFGRHTEPALLRSARDAGAAIVVPRSQLIQELPELLRSILYPAAPDLAH